jgi:hypothetical protein
MSEDYYPLYLWIDFRVIPASHGKWTLFTTGMGALGFLEIEVVETPRGPKEVVGFAFNIAHYLLDHGPILKHGDTIGLSATQKVGVTHTQSILEQRGKVYRLEL